MKRISIRAIKKSSGSILPVNGSDKMSLARFMSDLEDGEIFYLSMEKNGGEIRGNGHFGFAMILVDRIAKADGVPKTIRLDQLLVDFGVSFIDSNQTARKGREVIPYFKGRLWFVIEPSEYTIQEMAEWVRQLKLYMYENGINVEDLEMEGKENGIKKTTG